MPLHISEIGVRMAVREPGETPPADGPAGLGGAGSAGGAGGCGDKKATGLTGAQQDALVEQCVRQVLRVLKMREAR